ncbi:single-stranded DNA-binding protein [Nocardioides sp. SR21]|uniref:single-stranded DNA-binding protein n=1 Tax=Nocardioides sp. SR21 TaxID=2919501 RepID=UPI001FA9F17E|nr:single-stranded DNA-binding protein [Nocardioides sp. SR21]
MSAPKTKPKAGPEIDTANEVRLVGRISQPPEERVLPSGDSLWTFRVVVPRPPGGAQRRQAVDALECAAWSARARRSVASWAADDVVEVVGALHRRFYRSGSSVGSRVEVEMSSGRLIRRAARG